MMPDRANDLYRERFDTDMFMRVPHWWKTATDDRARATGLRRADMMRAIYHAGMVHLGIEDPDEGQDPGVPPETIAKVLSLRPRQS